MIDDQRLPRSFWAKVSPEPNTGCWLWTGLAKPEGYGRFMTPARKLVSAHRHAYSMLMGDIPAGLTLDHLCRTRCCVNPAHLEPVTHEENMRRAGARLRGVTHCKWGHAFDEKNTHTRPNGTRMCRRCNADIAARARAKAAR